MLQINRLSTFGRMRQSLITSMQSRAFSAKKEEGDKTEKNLTAVCGGSKMPPQKKDFCPPKKNKKLTCEELILQRDGIKKGNSGNLSAISGGGTKCPCLAKPKIPVKAEHSGRWQKYSLYGALPIVGLLSLIILTTHKEVERPEFKHWPFMYKREKPFYFYDGNRTGFHNKHINALPPAGYEDEIDEASIGKEAETDAIKKQRLKEFADVEKNWKKTTSNREAQAQKEAALAEKEAKKAEAEAAKEQKRQEEEEKKAAKKQEDDARNLAKRLAEEAKKAAKQVKAEQTIAVKAENLENKTPEENEEILQLNSESKLN